MEIAIVVLAIMGCSSLDGSGVALAGSSDAMNAPELRGRLEARRPTPRVAVPIDGVSEIRTRPVHSVRLCYAGAASVRV